LSFLSNHTTPFAGSGSMSLWFIFLFSLLCLAARIRSEDYSDVTVIVRGSETIASTSDEFICATMDWWPPEKCNYDQCPWGMASVLNLVSSRIMLFVMWRLVYRKRTKFCSFCESLQDLTNPLLAKAIQGEYSNYLIE